ncbi:MAG: nucleotide exchange factor GrpE [Actinobacteria bacterium]|jgi:molecular chaperone GrpE|nr:nucleotide exchange factor GrpE [Ilumatobacteraceae bacterium]NMD25710.1 nucleotide exchange factor GrpE [Actinomycetota bacterium]MBP7890096.1 nucleotide exchange factor GrpE [Ilumatobacteraceae bacterium]MBP8209261.1 nucleotide exchange factor GrpE [Ilumatobacteraceae bacterium]HQY15716.1 nucleotide exchange factor GrpE [Ilumatobacteraceae bacterium]
MSDDTRPDPTPPLAPEEVVLDDDLTSEMIRLRPLAADAVAAADATDLAEAEGALELDIEAVLAERDSFKDIALRLQADFDNYRRRVSVQQADDVQRATGKMAEALLPVLDACEAAFLQHPGEVEPIFNLLLVQLKKQGLETMNLHEQPFDPNLAEAVLHEEGDGSGSGAGPMVSEVLRSGYTWNGRVLRAAMVKVRG